MSQLVENYLHELYLIEELEEIDENFISWAKRLKDVKIKKLGTKLQDAFDRRDTGKLKKLMSIVPKPSMDKLEKMTKKTMGRAKYIKINKEVTKQLGIKFTGMPAAEERVIAFILTVMNNNVDDVVEGVTKQMKKLKKLLKSPKVKKIAGSEATLGMILIIAAAAIAIGAVATISLPILLISLLILLVSE